jgi:hypothetical protein
MKMKRTRFVAAVIVATAATIVSANATQITDNFNFIGTNYYDASGQFTYDSSTDQVLSITGSVTSLGPATAGLGGTNIALVPGGPGSTFTPIASLGNFFSYDNTFDPLSGTFNGMGVLFSFGNGNYGEIYDNNTVNATAGVGFSAFLPDGNEIVGGFYGGPIFFPGDSGSLTVSAAVPEMSTWIMMLLGFCGIGFAIRKKKIAMQSQRSDFIFIDNSKEPHQVPGSALIRGRRPRIPQLCLARARSLSVVERCCGLGPVG